MSRKYRDFNREPGIIKVPWPAWLMLLPVLPPFLPRSWTLTVFVLSVIFFLYLKKRGYNMGLWIRRVRRTMAGDHRPARFWWRSEKDTRLKTVAAALVAVGVAGFAADPDEAKAGTLLIDERVERGGDISTPTESPMHLVARQDQARGEVAPPPDASARAPVWADSIQVDGFGRGMPLSAALESAVPGGWTVDIKVGGDPNTHWDGGPLTKVLSEIADSAEVTVVLDEARQIVRVEPGPGRLDRRLSPGDVRALHGGGSSGSVASLRSLMRANVAVDTGGARQSLQTVIERIMPADWRVRIEIEDERLSNARVALTAQGKRRNILEDLLTPKGLVAVPYNGLNPPTLIISEE